MDQNPNHFSLFGLPVGFALDAAALQPLWRELQRRYHPDRYASAEAGEQQRAVHMASLVNQAYDTLRDPVKRARYLLELAGHGIDGERATVADTDFLMAQMDLREQLDEAETPEALDGLEDEAQDWLDNLLREFPIDYDAQDWSEAADTLRKMQFMTRLLDEIREQRERLEDELDAL